jgi:glutaminase
MYAMLDAHFLSAVQITVYAGAIMVSSLLKPQLADSARYNYIREFWERLTAGSKINIDNSVFLSERKTAHNNFALGYMMQTRNSS